MHIEAMEHHEVTKNIMCYPNAADYADDPGYRAIVQEFISITEDVVRLSEQAHAYAVANPSDAAGRTLWNKLVREHDAVRERIYARIETYPN